MTVLHQKVLQDIKLIKRPFEYVHCDIKIYWISPDPLWIYTTVTMILHILVVIRDKYSNGAARKCGHSVQIEVGKFYQINLRLDVVLQKSIRVFIALLSLQGSQRNRTQGYKQSRMCLYIQHTYNFNKHVWQTLSVHTSIC